MKQAIILRSKALLFTSNMLPKIKEGMGSLALIVAITTAVLSLVQLTDTKRVMSLNSYIIIKEGYSGPKLQFFAWLKNNAIFVLDDPKDHPPNKAFIDILGHLYMTEYLRSIEFVCDAYLQGLLGDEAEQFVVSYVKEDIEHLLLFFYTNDGTIGISEDINVDWIKPENPGCSEFGGYPATLKCISRWGIELTERSLY